MNDAQKYIVVLITAKDKVEARKIARALLKLKLVACVNIIDGVESLFRWKGKIDSSQEVMMVVKTKQKFFKKVVSKVKLLHGYQTPEIIALPIVAGCWDYLKWIDEVVS
ncbi:MAG: divalent-cation tolerance protein CutA [Candidatus Omnitrophota bacterium]